MQHAHDNHIGPALRELPERGRRWSLFSVAAVCAVLLFGLIATWPTSGRQGSETLYERVVGEISSIEYMRCHPQGTNRCARVIVEVDGAAVDLGLVAERSVLGQRTPGESVVLGYQHNTGVYFFMDIDRRGALATVGVVFAGIVVAFARWRGVRALGGLIASVGVLIVYTAPALLSGQDALAVCSISAATIAVASMFLMHGVRPVSIIAIGSILGALSVSLVLGAVIFPRLGLTGAVGEDAGAVQLLTGGIDLRGLLLGGTLIGALGALDDVAVTQIATVYELAEHRDLRGTIRGAMRIGREHVGAAVNTLVLAYVGAAMPILLLFAAGGGGFGTVLNSEEVATEVARAVVGSVGLVLAVPMATVLGGFAAHRWVPSRDGDPGKSPEG